jgi:hypothetical protein
VPYGKGCPSAQFSVTQSAFPKVTRPAHVNPKAETIQTLYYRSTINTIHQFITNTITSYPLYAKHQQFLGFPAIV